MKKLFSTMMYLIIAFFFIADATIKAQSSVLSWSFESNIIGNSFAHIGWSASDVQAVVANDPVTSGNKVLENTIHNYNGAPVLRYILPAGKTLADFNSFNFKGYFAQGDVGYKDIVVEAYQTMPTAQFANNASAKIGSWNRAKMGSTSWEDITVDITNSSTLRDTIYIAFGISCAGTGNVGGTGVTTIWYADNITIVEKTPTDVKNIASSIPNNYKLEQNYPNPFNPATIIEYSIPKSSIVILKIFDTAGREVATLENNYRSAGNYKINFDASKLASGVYFYKLTTNNYSATKKLILMK